ncbi:MAG: Tim44 domain-containing protein [Rhodobacteraceae bacterium]|jgi:predicted lipid-binding transport protein (Tim44 family)|uniref:Tim44/TimA family putative adaptor protein n=1 Tax=Albidovulum sp. TaxID=1872424 RepID=UPI001D7559D5|nr:Tim44/TimA family putative adaptor protein [uncultured Defluviimonas sp.]MCB2126849.1 Tim44 domain-containing protein [Paracoccaceae bacterium]MCC0070841.1 Tim44 domain-containing protein [Paracoccaceae bacterium]
MNSAVIQLLVLAAIAIFLILRLKNVLGSREGFEKPPAPARLPDERKGRFEVIEGGPDRDITDHVPDGSDAARALAAMKQAEPSFSVSDFLSGARGAYEMILMAFEKGDLAKVEAFLSEDVHEAFAEVVAQRASRGLNVTAEFLGIREVTLQDAEFDRATGEAELTVRFASELTSVARNAAGEIVEGDPKEVRRQRDIWTFARRMGSNDPNWQLVATGA